jgi:RNA polymerase sigma-70 factor (ECF subfamily)
MATTTSPSLLARVRDPADRGAWMEFDARYGELIVRYCRSRGLQHSDAEDVRQNVLLRLAGAMAEFAYDPRRGRFRSWLGRIAHNELIRHARRPGRAAARVGTGEGGGGAAAADDEAGAAWEREWLHHHLRLAMGTIRAAHDARSLAIFERLLQGEAAGAVAAAFGTSAAAVHKVKQRIRDRLRETVAAQVRAEDDPHERPPHAPRRPGG